MADVAARVQVLAARDWTAPTRAQAPLWPAFEAAALKLFAQWDVLSAAVQGGWSDGDPLLERARLMDDALANFAQRAACGAAVEPVEVVNFVVGAMDDRFNAEVDASTAQRLAEILVRLFEEQRTGNSTGLRFILGDAACDAVLARGAGFDVPLEALGAKMPAPQPVEESHAAAGAAQGAANHHANQQQGSAASATDEDGWTTVPSRRNGGGRAAQRQQQQRQEVASFANAAPSAAQAGAEEDDGWTTVVSKRRSPRLEERGAQLYGALSGPPAGATAPGLSPAEADAQEEEDDADMGAAS